MSAIELEPYLATTTEMLAAEGMKFGFLPTTGHLRQQYVDRYGTG